MSGMPKEVRLVERGLHVEALRNHAATHWVVSNGLIVWKHNYLRARAGSVAGKIRNFRRYVKVSGREFLAYRLLFALHYGRWPSGEIDHINRNSLDDRIENLREATRSTNSRNTKRQRNNRSGVTGVFWDRASSRWIARIGDGSASKVLGRFVSKADAVQARQRAEQELGYPSLSDPAHAARG